jgi:hypothetical protein
MNVSELEIDFINSILAEDSLLGYKHFLKWQSGKNFEGELSYSETIYLPYLYKRYRFELNSNSFKSVLEGVYKKNLLINSLAIETLNKFSNFLNQNEIQHVFIDNIAFIQLLGNDQNLRKITQIDCLTGQGKIILCAQFLNSIGYELNFILVFFVRIC